jgi:hypothetical protein
MRTVKDMFLKHEGITKIVFYNFKRKWLKPINFILIQCDSLEFLWIKLQVIMYTSKIWPMRHGMTTYYFHFLCFGSELIGHLKMRIVWMIRFSPYKMMSKCCFKQHQIISEIKSKINFSGLFWQRDFYKLIWSKYFE